MTKLMRAHLATALLAIWNKRGVPHMPVNEFTRLRDADLAHLFRFWKHKDKHWVEFPGVEEASPEFTTADRAFAKQPDFVEEPPKGWATMANEPFSPAACGEAVCMPAVSRIARGFSVSENFGRAFKSPAGGRLTERQEFKRSFNRG